jgi:hypothetical protein
LVLQGIPVFVTGDFNSPSHLDWTPEVAKVRPEVRYPVLWPASAALARAGFRDSYREVYPDPAANPGFTWTPGGPESDPHEVFDRIDWVLASGPARAIDSEIVGERGNPEVDIAFKTYPTDHRGVVSTYEVIPERPLPFAAVAERRVFVGDELLVRVHARGGSTVEIVADTRTANGPEIEPGARGSNDGDATKNLKRGCRSDCQRWFSFPTDTLSPGRYEADLHAPDGRVISRSPFWLYAAGTKPSVTVARPVYRVGEPIEVDVRAAPGMRWDWVAVFKAVGGSKHPDASTCNATPCGSGNYRVGQHTGSLIEGRTVIKGDWPYDVEGAWPLMPGRYEIRLLLDDGYRQLAFSAPFKVVAP